MLGTASPMSSPGSTSVDATRLAAPGFALEADSDSVKWLLDSLPHGVVIHGPDGRIAFSNRAAGQVLGLSKSQLEGRTSFDPCWAAIFPDGTPLPGEQHPAATAQRTKEPVLDFVMGVDRSLNGDRVWIEVNAVPQVDLRGELVHVVVCFTDVTARHVAQADREREHALLLQVLATSVAAFVVLDPSGQIIYANPSAEGVLGLTRSEIERRTFDAPEWRSTDLDGGPWPEEMQPFVRVLNTKAPVHDVRHCIEKPSGERKALLINGAPVLGADGEVELLVFSILDITDQLAADEERRRMHQRMEQLSREESLSILAGGVAHDFNNLLVGMLTASQLAVADLEQDHPAMGSLQIVQRTARRASELTRQLLAYSGRGHFVVEALDLTDVARETSNLAGVISRPVVLELEMEDNLPPVMADALQVKQVILNLVMNAVEATMASGGTVTLRTGAFEATELALARAQGVAPQARPGPYVFLEVEDDGDGMDPATVERIFEPFFTTKASGHGLGLAAVIGVIRGHGGFIAVDSAPARGTVIRLALPQADSQSSVATPSAVVTHGPDCGLRGPILVVDDEDVVRSVIRRTLERWRVDVWEAVSGPEALDHLQKADTLPEAVLLDVTMPRMSGMEVLGRIRERHPSLPVVLMSGYTKRGTESVDSNTLSLAKPFTPPDLLARLVEVVTIN